MSLKSVNMHEPAKLENSTFNIITAVDKQAMFLYSMVETYTSDAEKDNRPHLVETLNNIKRDKIKHIQMLREALAREVKEDKFR